MWHLLTLALLMEANMTSSVEITAQARTYDDDALRVEATFSGVRVLRGIGDSVVLSLGVVRPVQLSRLVERSANAVAQAKIFESNYRQGIWTAALGLVIWPVLYAINHIGANYPVPLINTIICIALVIYGAQRLDTARRALSKAVWWYNRDLKN